VLRMLCESADLTRARADRLLSLFPQSVRVQLSAQVEASMAQAGSGALPLEQLPSWALSLVPDFCTVEVLGQRLRSAPVPIVGRIQKDRLLLDMRTVFDRDLETVASTIEAVVAVAGA
jgi:L-seryl-tRNA(Ser) seleniumtransferase